MSEVRLKVRFMHATYGDIDPYPWDQLVDTLKAIDKDRRPTSTGKTDPRQVTFVVNHVGKRTLLSFHRPDLGKRVNEWTPGGIKVRQYGDDEGPTDALHIAHMEGRIFAVVREPGGPSHHDVSNYFGIQGGLGFQLHLVPIKREDARAVLDSFQTAGHVDFTIATSEIAKLQPSSPYRKALEAAATHVTCDEIGVRFIATRKPKGRRQWWVRQKASLEQLVDNDDLVLFSEAKAGTRDLLEQVVTAGSYISEKGGAIDAARVMEHIWDSYDEVRPEVRTALGLD